MAKGSHRKVRQCPETLGSNNHYHPLSVPLGAGHWTPGLSCTFHHNPVKETRWSHFTGAERAPLRCSVTIPQPGSQDVKPALCPSHGPVAGQGSRAPRNTEAPRRERVAGKTPPPAASTPGPPEQELQPRPRGQADSSQDHTFPLIYQSLSSSLPGT